MVVSQIQIEKIIDYAYNQVRTLVSRSNVDIENDEEIKYLYKQLTLLYKELGSFIAEQLPASIYATYLKGLKHAEQLLEQSGMHSVALGTGGIQDLVQAPLHMESISNIVSDTLSDLSAAFRTAKQYGHKNLDQAIYDVRNEIANGLITGMTTKQITQRVGEKFGKHGMTAFVTSDGKHLPVDFYAKTVTRTKLQQAENHGHLNRYKERNVKHVEVTGNIPTCGQCTAYRGIVFATETGDKFPYVDLHRLFPLHPNCQCNFRPYIVKFKSDEDIQQALDKSRMFDPDKDTRTVNEAKKYNATQKAKAVARKKRLSFNKMQSKLGKDGPQSFKEYRRASKKQYNDWLAQMNKMQNPNKDVTIIVESNVNSESEKQHMDNKIYKLENYGENVWKPKLSEHEKDVLKRYTKNESKVINAILNSNPDQIADELKDEIDKISSAINKFELQDDITVYRGISQEEYEQVIIGYENTFKTFLSFKSTSIDETKADIFSTLSNMDSSYNVEEKHILVVKVPKHSRAAYIASASDAPEEKEFLLDRHTNYRIIDLVSNDNTNYAIIEVI